MTFRVPHLMELAGGCNLRDLGGQETAAGMAVRRGVLYRSGVLTYLTPSDFNGLARARIATIVDLRSGHEILSEPTAWPMPVRRVAWQGSASIADQAQSRGWYRATTVDSARAWMIRFYVTMHEWLAQPLAEILRSIVSDDIPVLFHRAAGKDRTGFCAAIVLSLLGVPEATVLREYAFTDVAVDLAGFTKRFRGAALGVTDEDHPIDRMDAGVRSALLRADPAYLKAALDAVTGRFGSIESYARTALGLTDRDLDIMRYQLLDD